eukprot:ctg_2606.g774
MSKSQSTRKPPSTGQTDWAPLSQAAADELLAVVLIDRTVHEVLPGLGAGDQPACLVPLLNVPILAYGLQTLARSGVQEVRIMLVGACAAYAQEVEALLAQYQQRYAPQLRAQVLVGADRGWLSCGEALRELDQKEHWRPAHDFILMNALSLCSADLRHVVQRHRQRREGDNNWSAACLFCKAGTLAHAADGRCDDLLVAVDPRTRQLLRYRERASTDKYAAMDAQLFREHSCIDWMGGMRDCHIDVLSPEVLVEFRENFDYEHTRDYLRGKLESGESELLGNRVYLEDLDATGAYGAHICDYASYLQVTRDLLHEWAPGITRPLLGGAQVMLHPGRRSWSPPHYPDAQIHPEAVVEGRCALASGAVIGRRSRIVQSVLGVDVHVGSDVVVEHSILLDAVVLENGCTVCGAVVADGARVMKRARVGPGSVVGRGVAVAEGTAVPSGFALEQRNSYRDAGEVSDECDSENEGWTAASTERPVVSRRDERPANEYPAVELFSDPELQSDTDHSRDAPADGMYVVRKLNVQSNRQNPFARLLSSEAAAAAAASDRDTSSVSDTSASDAADSVAEAPPSAPTSIDACRQRLYAEIDDTVEKTIREASAPENAYLELNSLRMVYNCAIEELVDGITYGLLAHAQRRMATDADGPTVLQAVFRDWAVLLRRFVPSLVDPRRVLDAVYRCVYAHPALFPLFSYIVQLLYDTEVCDEDAIVAWHAGGAEAVAVRCHTAAEPAQRCVDQLAPFLQWLHEADEEEEEGDEEA